MERKFPNMFSPITIGARGRFPGLIFKNRVWTAPTGAHLLGAGEPYPNEAVIAHYREKARGGAACITFSGQNMDRFLVEHPDDIHNDANIFETRYHNYWYRLTSAVHFFDARISLELLAFCRHEEIDGEVVCWSVNGETDEETGEYCPMMTREAMERMAADYAEAAKIAVRVGFDMIMLHLGHGTFPAQFLSPLSNQRTDEFGGSAENRARFPMMLVKAVRDAVGPRVPIEVRVSGDELTEGGGTIEDCLDFLNRVVDDIDIAHVSCGTVMDDVTQTRMHPVEFYQPGCNAEFARKVKESGFPKPVLTLGAFQRPELIEETIATGGADIVAMARGCIVDADCVNKAAEGREDEIIPCLKCFVCLSYDMEEEFCCSGNPRIGREYILDQFENKNSTPKRVAVIGGGPGGMAAAQFCAERGHKVTLYEKDTKLGGTINFAKYATFKYSLDNYMNYRIHMMDKLGVDVRLGVEATPEMIEAENYDVVMAALGSSNIILPIEGKDDPRVICAVDTFGNADKIGQKVVVIGGGEVGCEAALYLAMECGKDVAIIEMMDRIAATSAYAQELALYDRVPKYCELHLSSPVTRITPTQVGYKDPETGEEKFLDADTVVFASGRKALEDEAEKFRFCAPKFFKIGDCVKASNVRNANRTAYDAAAQI